MIYVIGLIILICVICITVLFFKYIKLKDIEKSLDMCSLSIEEALEKKLKLVEELLKLIDNEQIKKKFKYEKESSIYEREDVLFNVSFEINKFVKEEKQTIKGKKNKNKSNLSDELLGKIRDLNEMEEGLDGLKDFYNTNVLNYNETFLKKYYHKIFAALKFPTYKSFSSI